MIPDFSQTINNIKINTGNDTWLSIGTTTGFDVKNQEYYDKFIRGVWECEEERNDNMDVLELYYERKRKEILEYYNEQIKEKYEDLEVVKEYNKLINDFKKNIKQLAEKYNVNDERPLIYTGYTNTCEYELNRTLYDSIEKKYIEQKEEDLKELSDVIEEIRAVLKISDDKDYQLDVLKKYEILDEEGKMDI